MPITPAKADLTARARTLAAALAERGRRIPHADALHAVARLDGFATQNAASAAAKSAGAKEPFALPTNDPAAMREAILGLLAWGERTGGWEDGIWDKARQCVLDSDVADDAAPPLHRLSRLLRNRCVEYDNRLHVIDHALPGQDFEPTPADKLLHVECVIRLRDGVMVIVMDDDSDIAFKNIVALPRRMFDLGPDDVPEIEDDVLEHCATGESIDAVVDVNVDFWRSRLSTIATGCGMAEPFEVAGWRELNDLVAYHADNA